MLEATPSVIASNRLTDPFALDLQSEKPQMADFTRYCIGQTRIASPRAMAGDCPIEFLSRHAARHGRYWWLSGDGLSVRQRQTDGLIKRALLDVTNASQQAPRFSHDG